MGEGSREREGRRDGLPALVSLHDPSGGEGSSGEGSGTGREEGTGSRPAGIVCECECV